MWDMMKIIRMCGEEDVCLSAHDHSLLSSSPTAPSLRSRCHEMGGKGECGNRNANSAKRAQRAHQAREALTAAHEEENFTQAISRQSHPKAWQGWGFSWEVSSGKYTDKERRGRESKNPDPEHQGSGTTKELPVRSHFRMVFPQFYLERHLFL